MSPFLNPFLNFWVPDKASIMWKKNNVTRLLNNHDFFHKMVLKMITAAACEGPGRCVAVEQNPLPCLPSIFNLAPDKLCHQHKNMTVLQLIGFEKYEKVRTA